MRKIYSSLDIGSDSVKMVIGEFIKNKLHILCAVEEATIGYKHNEITNPNELVNTIKRLTDKVYEQINFRVRKVILTVSTSYTNFIVTEGSIPINNEEKIVESSDILKVLQYSTKNRINPNDELICVEPIMFRVGDLETLEPYHKKGNVLSVKCVLVTGDKKTIYDLIDILLKCELEVIDITSSGLSDYYNFKNTNYDVKTGVVINLGNTSTIINIISKGIYINSEILDTGGYDIDKDIAFGYNLKRTEAKYLKETLASASIRTADAKETLKIANKDGKEIEVNQYELSEIVANRLSEILKLSKKSINHLTKKEISYIIITGGLTEIKDFSIELSSIYGENVKIGTINNIGARQNKFSASVGTLIYFNDKLNLRNKEYSTISENDIELMCNKDSKIGVANDSILGKVFGYFFDN
jgi:cell division protein FtsA